MQAFPWLKPWELNGQPEAHGFMETADFHGGMARKGWLACAKCYSTVLSPVEPVGRGRVEGGGGAHPCRGHAGRIIDQFDLTRTRRECFAGPAGCAGRNLGGPEK
jgi:hypothetical protein